MFGRIGEYRLRQPNQLKGAGEELLENYAEFEEDFMAFLPDAAVFAASVQREYFRAKDQGQAD